MSPRSRCCAVSWRSYDQRQRGLNRLRPQCVRSGLEAYTHNTHLLDNLVGADDYRLRHHETKRLRRFQIDYQLELRRLLDRQIERLRPLENFCDEDASPPSDNGKVCSIAEQAAGLGEVTRGVNRRKCMA